MRRQVQKGALTLVCALVVWPAVGSATGGRKGLNIVRLRGAAEGAIGRTDRLAPKEGRPFVLEPLVGQQWPIYSSSDFRGDSAKPGATAIQMACAAGLTEEGQNKPLPLHVCLTFAPRLITALKDPGKAKKWGGEALNLARGFFGKFDQGERTVVAQVLEAESRSRNQWPVFDPALRRLFLNEVIPATVSPQAELTARRTLKGMGLSEGEFPVERAALFTLDEMPGVSSVTPLSSVIDLSQTEIGGLHQAFKHYELFKQGATNWLLAIALGHPRYKLAVIECIGTEEEMAAEAPTGLSDVHLMSLQPGPDVPDHRCSTRYAGWVSRTGQEQAQLLAGVHSADPSRLPGPIEARVVPKAEPGPQRSPREPGGNVHAHPGPASLDDFTQRLWLVTRAAIRAESEKHRHSEGELPEVTPSGALKELLHSIDPKEDPNSRGQVFRHRARYDEVGRSDHATRLNELASMANEQLGPRGLEVFYRISETTVMGGGDNPTKHRKLIFTPVVVQRPMVASRPARGKAGKQSWKRFESLNPRTLESEYVPQAHTYAAEILLAGTLAAPDFASWVREVYPAGIPRSELDARISPNEFTRHIRAALAQLPERVPHDLKHRASQIVKAYDVKFDDQMETFRLVPRGR